MSRPRIVCLCGGQAMSVYNNLIDALDTVLAQANMLKPGREASLVRTKIDEGDG